MCTALAVKVAVSWDLWVTLSHSEPLWVCDQILQSQLLRPLALQCYNASAPHLMALCLCRLSLPLTFLWPFCHLYHPFSKFVWFSKWFFEMVSEIVSECFQMSPNCVCLCCEISMEDELCPLCPFIFHLYWMCLTMSILKEDPSVGPVKPHGCWPRYSPFLGSSSRKCSKSGAETGGHRNI